MSFDTPVCFIIFNRPDVTERVFREIARCQPRTLLVISDGPRSEHPGEAELVQTTRRIIEQVDWPCRVLKNYSEVNLGCKQRISSGLNWVFEQVEQAIILEDDCLPEPTFFNFCSELLQRYRDDERIMAVSGDNFQEGQSRTPSSYYFSKYPHCWGWASWRRAWKKMDLELKSWPDFQASGGMRLIADSPEEEKYWTRIFEQLQKGLIDSWAYSWTYSCWAHSGLTILPDVNLVSNIGFGEQATRTKKNDRRMANLPTKPIHEILHPRLVFRHKEADILTFNRIFKESGA